MSYCKTILPLCLITFFLACPLVAQQTNKPKPSAQLQEFINITGFTGDCTSVEDGRLFSKLSGKFQLPIPTDSLTLGNNTDFIANALSAIYLKKGANYTIKRISYSETYQSCQYIQYWKSFYLVHQPYYLLITWHPDSNTYSINNTLYMNRITIPEKVISYKTAIEIFRFVVSPQTRNPDLNSIPKSYALTDTASVSYDIGTSDDFTGFFLNLYPDNPEDKNTGFSLQWKNQYNMHWIDATSGKLRGKLLKFWQEKLPNIKAANTFIKNTGLSSEGSFMYDIDGNISFGDKMPDLAFRDTTEFRRFTEKYIPYLEKFYKQIGYDIKLDYSYTRKGGTESIYGDKFFETYYRQSYRYQQAYPSLEGVNTFIYNLASGDFRITPYFFKKKVIYPLEVLTPEYIFQKHLRSDRYYDENKQVMTAPLVLSYMPLDGIPKYNTYYHKPANLMARLCVLPIYSRYEMLTDIKLVWSIETQGHNFEYYDSVTGKNLYNYDSSDDFQQQNYTPPPPDPGEIRAIEQACATIGIPGEYQTFYKTSKIASFSAYLNLPEPVDSIQFESNCQAISTCLLNMYNLNQNDFSSRLQYYDNSYGYSPNYHFSLCFKSFEIMPPPEAKDMGDNYISYDSETNKYHISFLLSPYLKYVDGMNLPECVITPQTALYMTMSSDSLFYQWTELSNLSGEKNYFSDFIEPYISEFGENVDGPVRLQFYPYKNEKTGKVEYRLVWVVSPYDGCLYYIDAETGEILEFLSWDTC